MLRTKQQPCQYSAKFYSVRDRDFQRGEGALLRASPCFTWYTAQGIHCQSRDVSLKKELSVETSLVSAPSSPHSAQQCSTHIKQHIGLHNYQSGMNALHVAQQSSSAQGLLNGQQQSTTDKCLVSQRKLNGLEIWGQHFEQVWHSRQR